MQNAMMKNLDPKTNQLHRIISANKNCGLAIINTEHESAVSEHLNNSEVYKRLSKGLAYGYLEGVERMFESFINQHSRSLPTAELTYLKRGQRKNRGKMARFYNNQNA
ncbi:hypothetical protein ACHAXR_007518 [Thalassiosira sp. AJA248-18]